MMQKHIHSTIKGAVSNICEINTSAVIAPPLKLQMHYESIQPLLLIGYWDVIVLFISHSHSKHSISVFKTHTEQTSSKHSQNCLFEC